MKFSLYKCLVCKVGTVSIFSIVNESFAIHLVTLDNKTQLKSLFRATNLHHHSINVHKKFPNGD